MNRPLLLLAFAAALCLPAIAQKEKPLSPEETKELLEKIPLDSAIMLRSMAGKACDCIDSVYKAEKVKNKMMEGIAGCIDEKVGAYQLMVKLMHSMNKEEKNIRIDLVIDKSSNEYKEYYYDIERWLKDSCAIMNRAISTNDEAREKSFSENADAMTAYNKGVELVQKENYKDAIPWFEKAVKIDAEFAFAWDNLGVCYRRTDQYEKAESAYKASLKVDPKGKTPLQNLPVVYLLQKKDDEAIAAYKDILTYYPNDPEVYYGIGLVYLNNKDDLEKALDNMCKAYNIYVQQKSPYRTDAEKAISTIYAMMKKAGKEETFSRILSENNIKVN